MAFTTRTLRDTVVDQAGAGGTVTVLVNMMMIQLEQMLS